MFIRQLRLKKNHMRWYKVQTTAYAAYSFKVEIFADFTDQSMHAGAKKNFLHKLGKVHRRCRRMGTITFALILLLLVELRCKSNCQRMTLNFIFWNMYCITLHQPGATFYMPFGGGGSIGRFSTIQISLSTNIVVAKYCLA